MSTDSSPGHSEDSAPLAHEDTGVRRRATKTHRAPRKDRQQHAEEPIEDCAPPDPGERLRMQAAQILAATRERVVERPLQAVLVAAAAGAFAALLLGAGRR